MISQEAMADMLSEDLDFVYPFLLDIDHPDTTEIFRFTNNGEDVVFNEITYQHFPFSVTLAGENQQKAQLEITNVDGQIIKLLRETSKPIAVTFRVARLTKDNPAISNSEVEFGPRDFQTKQFSADAKTIRVEFGDPEDWLNQQFPKYKVTPATAPGAFK